MVLRRLTKYVQKITVIVSVSVQRVMLPLHERASATHTLTSSKVI